jgi:hypothetical protein
MKNNIAIIILLMAAIFVGCQKDEDYEPLNSFSDVGWYFSDTEGNLAASIGDYITFSDLSQGTIHHEWTIGEGNYFLKMPIARQDSIFDDKIIGSGTSKEKTVSVWFKKSGLNSVRLFNIFNEKVTFRGRSGSNNVFIDSKEVGGKWVIDTTFIVDVYDTIVPVIRIEQKGVVQNHTSVTDTIYVEAGDTVDLFDESTVGRADTWEWIIGSERSNEQNISMVLKKLGVFKGTFAISRTGNNIPGDYEFYRIPAAFKVIPSSQPFVIAGDIVELEDETIQIPYNGEFAPFLNQESHFSVTVNGTPFDIATVSLNPDDATLLWIKLVDPIYRPDVITVSYDGTGALESTDTRIPGAFTDLPVVMHNVNLWDDAVANFEEGPGGAWVKDQGPGTVEYSTEQAYNGTYSLKITSGNATFTRATGQESPATFEAGVGYLFTWWVYQDPSTTVGSYGPWLFWNAGAAGQQFWQSTGGGKPKGAWYQDSRLHVMPVNGPAYFTLRVNNTAILYLDGIHVVKNEVRP